MRVDWLDDLLAVAETGSFIEAAERRNLSASAFSRRLRGIEDHVGAELFDRGRKPAQLHPGVEAQRDRLAQLAVETRQLVADLRSGVQAGHRLVISSQHALTATLAPMILLGLQRHRDDITTRLRSANLADCFAQLFARQADIALVYRVPEDGHPIQGTSIESLTLGEDRLVPVIASGSAEAALAGGELPVVAYPSDVFLGDVMARRLLRRLPHSLRPRVTAETELTLAAMELAAMGLGVAWVPRSLAGSRIKASSLADLSGELPSCHLDVTAVRLRGDAGQVAAEVWDHLARIRPSEIES